MIRPAPRQPALLPLLLCLAAASAPALAQAPAPPGVDAADDAEVAARLDRIEASLEDGKAYANVWWYGWMAIQFGSAGAFGGLAIADPGSPDAPANGVTGALGLLSGAMLLVVPAVPAYAPYRLRKLPEDTPGARRAKLAAAEDLLERSASYEEAGRAWYSHLLNFAFAAAGGLLLAFAFEDTDWKDGLYNFCLLYGVGELQIATQPTRAIRDWNAYVRDNRPAPGGPKASVSGFAAPGGAAVQVSF